MILNILNKTSFFFTIDHHGIILCYMKSCKKFLYLEQKYFPPNSSYMFVSFMPPTLAHYFVSERVYFPPHFSLRLLFISPSLAHTLYLSFPLSIDQASYNQALETHFPHLAAKSLISCHRIIIIVLKRGNKNKQFLCSLVVLGLADWWAKHRCHCTGEA
jgi:hypothetical protein